jgi:D-alanyl-D-alanine-carboxypeptidase/D-alanyl-D-alanine-endopeptidase
MNKNEISQKLIAFRKQKGFSQEQLSNESGVALRTVQRIEAASVSAHLQTLSLLASALNIEVSELTVSQVSSDDNSDKNQLILLHLTPIIGCAFPFGSLLLPIALWFYKRNNSIAFDRYGRLIINFQLTMSIISFLAFLSIIFHYGPYTFLIFVGSIIFNVIMVLVNSWRIWKSISPEYPFSIPFLKIKRNVPVNSSLQPT